MSEIRAVMNKLEENQETLKRLYLTNAFYAGLFAGFVICLIIFIVFLLSKWGMQL